MTAWIVEHFGISDFQARLCVLGLFFASAVLWGLIRPRR